MTGMYPPSNLIVSVCVGVRAVGNVKMMLTISVKQRQFRDARFMVVLVECVNYSVKCCQSMYTATKHGIRTHTHNANSHAGTVHTVASQPSWQNLILLH